MNRYIAPALLITGLAVGVGGRESNMPPVGTASIASVEGLNGTLGPHRNTSMIQIVACGGELIKLSDTADSSQVAGDPNAVIFNAINLALETFEIENGYYRETVDPAHCVVKEPVDSDDFDKYAEAGLEAFSEIGGTVTAKFTISDVALPDRVISLTIFKD